MPEFVGNETGKERSNTCYLRSTGVRVEDTLLHVSGKLYGLFADTTQLMPSS
jgi:hypothetical protein